MVIFSFDFGFEASSLSFMGTFPSLKGKREDLVLTPLCGSPAFGLGSWTGVNPESTFLGESLTNSKTNGESLIERLLRGSMTFSISSTLRSLNEGECGAIILI